MTSAELIIVAGGTTAAGAGGVEQVVAAIRAAGPGTAVLHHDLLHVAHGVVRRRLRIGEHDTTALLELAHGCVSCTLREDVLPMLRVLAGRPDVARIVLHLDPVIEPEQVCWAVRHVLVDGSPVIHDVDLRGVVTVIDAGTWLADATSDADLPDRGLARLPDDERTIAQLVVAQAEFADLVVMAGPVEPWLRARTGAVLTRLAPLAPQLHPADLDARLLLADLPVAARRGVPDHAHAPLLRGEPPLDADGDVRLVTFTARRPFHPGRLHTAIDVLLDGVVRVRGRIWLATRPEACLWVESAGGELQVGYVGEWLAAAEATSGERVWAEAEPERRVAASLRWHARWGDRVQELAILVDGADPDEIDAVLREALIDDRELARGERAWAGLPDPFGWWHTDPCSPSTPERTRTGRERPDQKEDDT